MRLKESELDNSIQKQIEDEESLTSELDMTREQYYKEKREAMETEDLSDEFLEDETEKPTHTMLLNNLVKEVEIFSDDEDFMTPTKKWKISKNIMKSTITRFGENTARKAYRAVTTVWTGLNMKRSSTLSAEMISRQSIHTIWRHGWL